MLINGYLNKPNIYSTLCDDYQATYNATTSLLKEGRKKILHLYTKKSYSGIQKINGYKDAMEDNGYKVDEAYIQSCPGNIHSVKEKLLSLNEDGLVFDGILAAEDILAVGGLKYAKSKGIPIPEDLSIIGYNNSILSGCCEPELTSIDNHVETLSLTTVNTLMRVLSGNDVPNKTVISTDLVKRNTTIY